MKWGFGNFGFVDKGLEEKSRVEEALLKIRSSFFPFRTNTSLRISNSIAVLLRHIFETSVRINLRSAQTHDGDEEDTAAVSAS
ncbi:hypothetical protein P8452_63685 [Trifolium repens]|nr:hypothetical protein P8452_63685 [Trifolium repens]